MAALENEIWSISVDTGGTFTDVVAVDPAGRLRRLKILSDASSRQVVQTVHDNRSLSIAKSLPDGLFDGATLLTSSGQRVHIERQRASRLEFSEAVSESPGNTVELSSPLQAPALAAHWITGTAVGEQLPSMHLRLATTRGTNALLERQGARCAMLLSAGLEDLLSIGTQQRPDLFARVVRKSPPLAERCAGVRERLDFEGRLLESLDVDAARRLLEQLRADGILSIGIALVHSYRNGLHEEQLAALAEEAGFPHISISSELSVRQGYLERARGCEINAYLLPVLDEYLGSIRDALSQPSTLLVMSSAGELVSPKRFQPKDSLLSGPAGGVLGAAQAARAAGLSKALAFDMGGTSTDVARIEGEAELTFHHRVGDAEQWAAAVDVESVAAGGGSICWIKDGLPQVGPQSAGARPGPACYGVGGPLAITDVNLLLGRLRPERFPFALDTEAARKAARACLDEMAEPSLCEEILLEGFLRVANERMAEAIRRVTIRRGRDPRDHALVAFGGAGGQHACAIASLLDLSSVLIPPDPSLLSAVGVASAARSRTVERQILEPLQDCLDAIAPWMEELSERAKGELIDDGVQHPQVTKHEAELRFRGQESVVSIEFARAQQIAGHFLERYEEIHLHRPAERDIELVTLRLKAEETTRIDLPTIISDVTESAPAETTRLYHDGAWHVARVYQREQLALSTNIAGPALIEEEHSVFFLPPNWSATVHESGALLAHASETHARPTVVASDAVERQLFMHRFEAIAKEMGERLRHVAVSTNVKEREDFSCAVLDAEGRLVVNAPHIPVHLGALGSCVRAVRQHMKLEPGDFVVTNHPAFGGSHLPDITILAPVHADDGELIAHVACRAHHAEIGGISPGSMPARAQRLVEEGVVLEPMSLARDGAMELEPLRRALRDAPYPSRSIENNLADAQAMLVACKRGADALRELSRVEGGARLMKQMGGLREHAATSCRRALTKLGEGEFAAQIQLDDGSPLSLNIQVKGDQAVFDFGGSAPTHAGNLNATEAVVTSCVLYVLRLLAGADLPFNEGLLDPVELIIPRGILSPDFSGPLESSPAIVGGNVETSQRLVDLLLTALDWSACSQGTMNNLSFGNDGFGYYETLGGGAGAGPDFDGESAVHSHMTNTRITDVEVLEHRHPVRVRRFSIRRESGGVGSHRGGDGIVRELEFTESVRVSLLTQHRAFGPAGASGGLDGAAGRQWVVRNDGTIQPLDSIAEDELVAGERIVVETPGGGGWGRD